MIATMRLPSALSFLLDDAAGASGADAFLTALGAKLVADGLPLAGGAFTQAAPHPIIARRTWLWRADTGRVIEALGFGFAGPVDPGRNANVGRDWLAGLGLASCTRISSAALPTAPCSAGPRRGRSTRSELELLREVARFAAAPLAALAARSTLSVLLETYLGRRSAAQVLAGRLRREPGETIRAALLYADLAASPNCRSRPSRSR